MGRNKIICFLYFCVPVLSFTFSSIHRIQDTYQFSKKVFLDYGYDSSHGIGHAMDVTKFANDIFEFDVKHLEYSEEKKNKVKEIIFVTSLLHDTIDKKYSPGTTQFRMKSVERFLLHDLEYSPLMVKNIMRIMNTMSYSLTVKNCSEFHLPSWITKDDFIHKDDYNKDVYNKEDQTSKYPRYPNYHNHSKYPWKWIYHTVRQADLLTSYDVERMLSYKFYNINKNMSFVLQDTKDMFQTRIASLTTIPGLFPSLWAFTESKRLFKLCGIMMDIIEKEKLSIVAPFQFSKYRTLDPSPGIHQVFR